MTRDLVARSLDNRVRPLLQALTLKWKEPANAGTARPKTAISPENSLIPSSSPNAQDESETQVPMPPEPDTSSAQPPSADDFLIRHRLPRPLSRAYEALSFSLDPREAFHRACWCAGVTLRFLEALRLCSAISADPDLPPRRALLPPPARGLARRALPH